MDENDTDDQSGVAIMHKRKTYNMSLKYKKSFKINKNLFDKKSIDK